MGLFVLPGQRRIDASRMLPVELVFDQLAQLHGIAPVAKVGHQVDASRQDNSRDAARGVPRDVSNYLAIGYRFDSSSERFDPKNLLRRNQNVAPQP